MSHTETSTDTACATWRQFNDRDAREAQLAADLADVPEDLDF